MGGLNIVDCIQNDMTRCTCIARQPNGVKYHPSLKAVYERSGAKGTLVKVGLRCPKCGQFYPL